MDRMLSYRDSQSNAFSNSTSPGIPCPAGPSTGAFTPERAWLQPDVELGPYHSRCVPKAGPSDVEILRSQSGVDAGTVATGNAGAVRRGFALSGAVPARM